MSSNAFVPSQLEIVNQVLSELGRLPVDSVDVDQQAQLIANRVDKFIPLLLLKAPWNFAIKYRTDSTPVTENFSPEYTYTYQLPADYGRIYRFYQQWVTPYAFFDGLLATSIKPVQYYYVVKNVDYDVIIPSFERCLVLYVASTVSLVITQNVELTQYLNTEYKNELSNAVTLNDMERDIRSGPYNDYDRINYI